MVEAKIEEFLVNFGERLSSLSEEAFRTQVTALIKLKECEDAHLGEEVDRHWFEVVTQQYVFRRLQKEVSEDGDSQNLWSRRRFWSCSGHRSRFRCSFVVLSSSVVPAD